MATEVAPVAASLSEPAPPGWLPSLRPLVRNPLTLSGLIVVACYLAVVGGASLLAPRDPVAINPGFALRAPSIEAWFGGDRFGRDVLSRVIFGSRASIGVGVGAIAIAGGVGSVVGLLAGFYGGAGDLLPPRLLYLLLSLPPPLLALVNSVRL